MSGFLVEVACDTPDSCTKCQSGESHFPEFWLTGNTDFPEYANRQNLFDACDSRMALRLKKVIAADQDPKHLDVRQQGCSGFWGPTCNQTIRDMGGLIEPFTETCHFWHSIIRQEDFVDLMELITPSSTFTKLSFTQCTVGLSGLRALIEAVKRCESITEVCLFNVGPRKEGKEGWESLGCHTAQENDDCVLLRELFHVLWKRGGGIENEAFMDDCSGGATLRHVVALERWAKSEVENGSDRGALSLYKATTECCHIQDSEKFFALLRNGADTSYKADDILSTALHLAAAQAAGEDAAVGMRKCLEALCNAPGVNINAQEIDGQTALHKAACCGNYETVKILLNHGANETLASKDEGTPLDCVQLCIQEQEEWLAEHDLLEQYIAVEKLLSRKSVVTE